MSSASRNQTPSAENRLRQLYEQLPVHIGLIVFLAGLVVFLTGYFLQNELVVKIGEFVLLVLSLHFLYEHFTKEADREALSLTLTEMLEPSQTLLAQLQATVATLDQHTRTVFDLVRFTDAVFFEKTWTEIVAHADRLVMVGDCPPSLVDRALAATRGTRKSLVLFTTLRQDNREFIDRLLATIAQEHLGTVRVYHIDRLDWGFVTIGTRGASADVLLNYIAPSGEAGVAGAPQSGYHLFGDTGAAVLRSLEPKLSESGSSSADATRPLRLHREVIPYLLDKRRAYAIELDGLNGGVPLQGQEAICDRMSLMLANTHQTLRVTHVARGESIKLMEDARFRSWLEENYRAAARGVNIHRIFLVPRSDLGDPTLLKVAREMHDHEITVTYRVLDDLDRQSIEDFSVYDGKELIYICTASSGAWIEQRTEARHTSDEHLVKRYSDLFVSLASGEKPFPSTVSAPSPHPPAGIVAGDVRGKSSIH